MKESTRIREAFYTEFAEQVKAMDSPVPVQLSGGFRSRTGMADAIHSGACDLIGLGRAAVLEPELPRKILLNPEYDDEGSVAMSHELRGVWFANMIPVKVVGAGLPVQVRDHRRDAVIWPTVRRNVRLTICTGQFFYYNMRRLGDGLKSDPHISIPGVVLMGLWETARSGVMNTIQKVIASLSGGTRVKLE